MKKLLAVLAAFGFLTAVNLPTVVNAAPAGTTVVQNDDMLAKQKAKSKSKSKAKSKKKSSLTATDVSAAEKKAKKSKAKSKSKAK